VWNVSNDPADWDGRSRDDFLNYLDPFNCECRGFGLLKERKREDLAIRVFGYLYLSEKQEQYLNMHYEEDDIWDRTPDDKNKRVRAIVKELVDSQTSFRFQPAAIPKMFADLTTLHELGILVRDIHEDNYLNNLLLDLSMAWTMPHPFLEDMTLDFYLQERTSDALDFFYMIDYWNQENKGNEQKQIREPPGFHEYLNWGLKDLGKRPCHPHDLDWDIPYT
jgi:hypothetical protein